MLQNLSFHLKIITGLSRLPALLSAFILPYLDKQETLNGQHFSETLDSTFFVWFGFWGFFWFSQVCRHCLKSLQFSRQLCTAMDRGDIATERGGLILPSPWDCFRAGVILDVKSMEVGLVCHLLCSGTLGAALMWI